MTQKETAARLSQETPAATETKKLPSNYDTVFDLLPTLKATPALQSCAKHLTIGRQRGKHLSDPSASIGTEEQDFEATYYGTLAELCLYLWLEQQGLRPVYTLLDRRAVTEADFTLDGLRYEIKCSPPGKTYLSISQRQHHDPRRQCDFYLCCLYETSDTLRVCKPVSHSDVSRWMPMTNGHEPYYSRHRAELLALPRVTLEPGNMEETEAFLAALMRGYDDPALRLEIRPAFPTWQQATLYPNDDAPGNWQFFTPSGKRQWFPLTAKGIAQATQHSLCLAGGYEVYFGVLPRTGNNGKAVDVPATFCLWCDIDGGFEGVAGAQVRLDAAIAAGRLSVPDFTVVSGGGLHVYWLLTAPVVLSDHETRIRFKQTLQRLCRAIGGESPAAHADSSRADVASILRVPGTFNCKREQEPRLVRLLSNGTPTEQHSLTWWNANLPALPAPPPKPFPKSDTGNFARYDGLLRWARTPYPEGKRHKDLAGAAAWLVREVGLSKPLAHELLMMKAQASSGTRQITPEEVEAIIEWA